MKTILAICLVLSVFTDLYSQDNKTDTAGNNRVYTTVQVQPKFPGDINKYLGDKLKYPKDAKAKNIEGTVYVSFIVEKDGSISHVEVKRGVDKGESLEKEAVSVVSAMPKWIPGKENGQPVRVKYMIPIRFTLGDNNSPNQKKN